MIVEVDRDYRTVTGTEVKEFESREAADAWCQKETWTGYRYSAMPLDPSGNTGA